MICKSVKYLSECINIKICHDMIRKRLTNLLKFPGWTGKTLLPHQHQKATTFCKVVDPNNFVMVIKVIKTSCA